MKKLIAGLVLCLAVLAAPEAFAQAGGVGTIVADPGTNLTPVQLISTETRCRSLWVIGQASYNTNNAATIFVLTSTNQVHAGIPVTTGAVLRIDGGPLGINLTNIFFRVQDTNDRATVFFVK